MGKIIIYDFDGTLTPQPLPKFEILEKCGMENGIQNPRFLELTKEKMKEKQIDLYEAIYEVYFEIIKTAGFALIDETFTLGYDNVYYNTGVTEFLDMLTKNKIDNYLLSSGIKVFLEKVSIAAFFKDIYATTFNYNQDNQAISLNYVMSDKNKVAALKDILKKRNINIENCSDIIYIGDGLTDYYAMQYVKDHGGTSIFVYNDPKSKDIITMNKHNIVDLFTLANFSPNSELESYVKKLCKIK